MRRTLFCRALAALSCFAVGVACFLVVNTYPRIDAKSTGDGHAVTSTFDGVLVPLLASVEGRGGDVEVKFQRWRKTDYFSYAEFKVVNGGAEPLYYSGYGKDSHCAYKIRRGGEVEQQAPCWCGTGLAERKLWPGESATYTVIGKAGGGKFEVGFDFAVGRGRRPQTAWSDEVVTLDR